MDEQFSTDLRGLLQHSLISLSGRWVWAACVSAEQVVARSDKPPWSPDTG